MSERNQPIQKQALLEATNQERQSFWGMSKAKIGVKIGSGRARRRAIILARIIMILESVWEPETLLKSHFLQCFLLLQKYLAAQQGELCETPTRADTRGGT